MGKVLTVGGATVDIFINYQDAETLKFSNKSGDREFLLLEYGGKLEVKNLNYYTGGGGTNSAVSFSRLGFSTSIVCKVGNDLGGKNILKKLTTESVCTDNITVDENEKTGTSFIIPSLEHDRTILAFRGANTLLEAVDISEKLQSKYK